MNNVTVPETIGSKAIYHIFREIQDHNTKTIEKERRNGFITTQEKIEANSEILVYEKQTEPEGVLKKFPKNILNKLNLKEKILIGLEEGIANDPESYKVTYDENTCNLTELVGKINEGDKRAREAYNHIFDCLDLVKEYNKNIYRS